MKVSWILTGIVLLLIAYIYTMKNRVKRVGDKEVIYVEREQPITEVIVPEYVDDTVYYYPNWDWLPWYGWGGSGGDVNVYNRYGWGGGGRRWGGRGGGYGGIRGGIGGGMRGGMRGGMGGGRGGGGRGGR